MTAQAFYSEEDRCWYVPVACELLEQDETPVIEPARVEFKDGQLWITKLEVRP